MTYRVAALAGLISLMSCGPMQHRQESSSNVSSNSGAPAKYIDSVQAWQTHRNAGLRSPDSWLTLVGLFWLRPGENQIGSSDSNDLVLPKTSAPARLGRVRLVANKTVFRNEAGPLVTVNGKPVKSPVTLSYDEEKPDVVKAGTISFFVIKRLDKFAIRAKDSDSPVLKNFHGMDFFAIDPKLHFPDAKLISDPKKIPILNVVGQTEMQDSPGVVQFSYAGQTYHLRPVYEGKTLFFLFKDLTNKTETYQAGRMLNAPLPVDGRVNLDFNRSYNPPCTFTPYATCSLPPKDNILPFAITAGEKRFGKGHPAVS